MENQILFSCVPGFLIRFLPNPHPLRLVALIQAGVNARPQLQNLFKSEPSGIELSQLCFCFFEHSEIDVALNRLNMAKGVIFLQADRSHDIPTHNCL